MININKIILFILFFSCTGLYAQKNESLKDCQKLLPSDFISDGRDYSMLISESKKGILDIPFTGGHTYRIIICSKIEENLVMKLYDKDMVLLFSSNQFKKSTFYDFEFPTSVKCIIEVEIFTTKKIEDFVNIVVGFKEI